jgi:hypothetical protein
MQSYAHSWKHYVSICLSLSVRPSVRPSVYLPIYLSTYILIFWLILINFHNYCIYLSQLLLEVYAWLKCTDLCQPWMKYLSPRQLFWLSLLRSRLRPNIGRWWRTSGFCLTRHLESAKRYFHGANVVGVDPQRPSLEAAADAMGSG